MHRYVMHAAVPLQGSMTAVPSLPASHAVQMRRQGEAQAGSARITLHRISLQDWCGANWSACQKPAACACHPACRNAQPWPACLPARSTYTQAFVRELPLHRALPILFWVGLTRLLRWKPPVLPLRRRILHEARREGLGTMYRVILGAFGPEMGCALRVRAVCRLLLAVPLHFT